MLWIALHLPLLSLESFAATLGAAQEALPLGLLDGTRLSAANRVAQRLGIEPGLKRSTALALAPHLVFGQACAVRDAQALLSVAHAALEFTPSVALQGDCTVLLEVQPSLRAFGGLARLLECLQAALAPLRHTVRTATAPTALGAALLAQWGLKQPAVGPHTANVAALCALLDSAPVALLGAGSTCKKSQGQAQGRAQGQAHEKAHEKAQKTARWQALQSMGVHTLADLRALPRAGVARRFGEALLTELDRARGDRPDPREWVVLPSAFETRLELFARADTTEQVLHGAQTLLARLVAWARARQARVLRFTLAMQHEPRHRAGGDTPACTELEIALAEASGDAAHLQVLLRERLGRLPLPAPTLELRLRCHDLVHRAPPSGELFPSRTSEREGLTRLLERLQARLGPTAVQGLRRVADHRPECATVLQPPGAAAPAHEAPLPALQPPETLPHLTRPVWLLNPPQSLREQGLLPLLDGRPLQLLAGPERIEAGWWNGTPAARDYFVAQAHSGALVWVFRTRLPLPPSLSLSLSSPLPSPSSSSSTAAWFLHGRFA